MPPRGVSSQSTWFALTGLRNSHPLKAPLDSLLFSPTQGFFCNPPLPFPFRSPPETPPLWGRGGRNTLHPFPAPLRPSSPFFPTPIGLVGSPHPLSFSFRRFEASVNIPPGLPIPPPRSFSPPSRRHRAGKPSPGVSSYPGALARPGGDGTEGGRRRASLGRSRKALPATPRTLPEAAAASSLWRLFPPFLPRRQPSFLLTCPPAGLSLRAPAQRGARMGRKKRRRKGEGRGAG